MMGANLLSILSGFLKLALLAGATLYTGLVVMSYLSDGPRLRPRFEWHDPAHSAQRVAVWLGVRVLALAVQASIKIFGMLSEASADVGEWVLERRRHESR